MTPTHRWARDVYKHPQILGNKAAAYSLTLYKGLERIRCSVLIFVLASIYYMRALVYSPHDPCSIDFSRFLSACCTLFWVVGSDRNCIHRWKRWYMVEEALLWGYLSEMKYFRYIPGPEERRRWYNSLQAPEILLRSSSRLEAVINGTRAEIEHRKARLFYAHFLEHWVL